MSFSIMAFYKMYKNTCAEFYSEHKKIPLSDIGCSEVFQGIFLYCTRDYFKTS